MKKKYDSETAIIYCESCEKNMLGKNYNYHIKTKKHILKHEIKMLKKELEAKKK